MDRLKSDKVDFRAKEITRYREVYYIMTNVSIHQEDIVILNRYTTNNHKICEANFIELKEEIDKFIIIVGVFNMLLSFDRPRQKISKDMELHNTINNMI